MLRIILFCIALALPGCASWGTSGMSAAEITAAGKDKSASIICSTFVGVWGTVKLVTMNLDQKAIQDGGVAIDGERGCTVTVTSAAPPKPVSAVPAKPAAP